MRSCDLCALELLAETIDAFFGGRSPEAIVHSTGDTVNNVKADIQREIERLCKEIGNSCATRTCIEPPAQARSPLMSEDRRKCIEALAGELEDRDVLLERLSQPSDRVEWLRGTKRAVLAQIANGVVMSERVDADLLISTLSQMSASERARTFKDWLERSMPQIEANFTNEFAVDWYQYWTLIGVSDPDGFRRQFGDEIEVAFHSTTAGARKGNLPVIVGMYVPGRAVCYVELSGIPLTALKSLETCERLRSRVSARSDRERFIRIISSAISFIKSEAKST